MATILNNMEEEDDTGEASTGGAGATSVISSPTAPSPAPTAKPEAQKPASSGSFTNLSKYIQANKGFKQATGGLAGNIVGNINKQAQNVQKNVAGAQNQFQTAANQASSGFKDTSLVNQALADPYAFAKDQASKEAFAKIRDAQYTGPKSLQDLSGAQSLANLQLQASNVQNTAKAGQTESGRFNLLKSMFGNKDYSRGQRSLDNVLLQQNPDQLKKLQGAAALGQQASQAVASNETAAQTQAKALADAADAARTGTRTALNEAVVGSNKGLQDLVDKEREKLSTGTTKLQQALASGKLTPAQYAALGGEASGLTAGTSDAYNMAHLFDNTAKIGSYLYGVDPTSYISGGAGPTAQNLAKKADYDKFAALNELMGGGSVASEDASKVLQSFTDPSQAESYKEGYNFDSAAFRGALDAKKAAVDAQRAEVQKNLSDAEARYQAKMHDLENQFMPFDNNDAEKNQARIDQQRLRAALNAKIAEIEKQRGSQLRLDTSLLGGIKPQLGPR